MPDFVISDQKKDQKLRPEKGDFLSAALPIHVLVPERLGNCQFINKI